jgi:predicted ATPase
MASGSEGNTVTALEQLHVRGYRRLLDVDLPMKPFSVLIGANGSGKTSFLEVLSLLAASCNGRLSAAISELGGVGDIVTRDRATAIEIDVSSPVTGHQPLEYGLRIEPRGFRCSWAGRAERSGIGKGELMWGSHERAQHLHAAPSIC